MRLSSSGNCFEDWHGLSDSSSSPEVYFSLSVQFTKAETSTNNYIFWSPNYIFDKNLRENHWWLQIFIGTEVWKFTGELRITDLDISIEKIYVRGVSFDSSLSSLFSQCAQRKVSSASQKMAARR